jgi:hypothetical protein
MFFGAMSNLKAERVSKFFQDANFPKSERAGRGAEYNQEDATFHNLFISVRRSTCFRQSFRPP